MDKEKIELAPTEPSEYYKTNKKMILTFGNNGNSKKWTDMIFLYFSRTPQWNFFQFIKNMNLSSTKNSCIFI